MRLARRPRPRPDFLGRRRIQPGRFALTPKGIEAVLGAPKGEAPAATSSCRRTRPSASTPSPTVRITRSLIWQIADGYYLDRTRVKAATTSDKAQLGALEMPKGETKSDEYFGKQEIYHHELVAGVAVARASATELALPLQVTYQGCATAGLCYPPITKDITVSLPPGNWHGTGTAACGKHMQAVQPRSALPASASVAGRQQQRRLTRRERERPRRVRCQRQRLAAGDRERLGHRRQRNRLRLRAGPLLPPSSSRATPS